MIYILSEQQYKSLNQSAVNMGPYGDMIRRVFELYSLKHFESFAVIYNEKYDNYLLVIDTDRYINSMIDDSESRKIQKFIKSFVPVEVIVLFLKREDYELSYK